MSRGRITSALALALLIAIPAPAGAQGKPIVGGGSFNTAPLLAPGRYSDTVAAGETVYWKVRLAKGQLLEVTATIDTSSLQRDASKPDYQVGLDNLDYTVDLHSPLREAYDGEYPDASADLIGDSGAGSVTNTARSPRILGFEQILASDFNVDKFPAPGVGFISVSASDSDFSPAEVPAELPVDLDIAIVGTAQPSSPDFAGSLPGPAPQDPAPAQDPTSAIGGGAGADLGDASVTIGLVALLAFLGAVALGMLAAVVLGRGRVAAITPPP